MKHICITLIFTLCSLMAMGQSNTVTVDINQLPQNLQEAIAVEADRQVTVSKVKAYGEWVGLGKEIGTAVDGSLTALTSHAVDFSETDLGRLTMALVIFKVAGKDLVGIIIGTLMILTLVPLSSFFLFKKTRTKTLVRGSRLKGTAEYEFIKHRGDYIAGAVGLWAICNLGIIGLSCAIMFA